MQVIFRVQFIAQKNIVDAHYKQWVSHLSSVCPKIFSVDALERLPELNLLFLLCGGSVGVYSLSEMNFISLVELPAAFAKERVDRFCVRFLKSKKLLEMFVCLGKNMLRMLHEISLPDQFDPSLPSSFFSMLPHSDTGSLIGSQSDVPPLFQQLNDSWTFGRQYLLPSPCVAIYFWKSVIALAFKQEYALMDPFTCEVKTVAFAPPKKSVLLKSTENFLFCALAEKALVIPVDSNLGAAEYDLHWKGPLNGVGFNSNSIILMQPFHFQVFRYLPSVHVQTLTLASGDSASLLCDDDGFLLVAVGAEVHLLQPIPLKLKIIDEVWLSQLNTLGPPLVYDILRNHLNRVLASTIHPFGQMVARFIEHFNTQFDIPFYYSIVSKEAIDSDGLLSLGTHSIHSFLSCISESMALTWPILSNFGDLMRITKECVQESVYPCIHATVMSVFQKKYADMLRAFQEKIVSLTDFGLRDFGCDFDFLKKIPPADQTVFPPVRPIFFYEAIELIRSMSSLTSPLTKLQRLGELNKSIISSAESMHCDYLLGSTDSKQVVIAADDLVSIMCFVIVQSQSSQILLDYQYLRAFVNQNEILGQEGYMLTTLQVCIQNIFTLHSVKDADLLEQVRQGKSGLEIASKPELTLFDDDESHFAENYNSKFQDRNSFLSFVQKPSVKQPSSLSPNGLTENMSALFDSLQVPARVIRRSTIDTLKFHSRTISKVAPISEIASKAFEAIAEESSFDEILEEPTIDLFEQQDVSLRRTDPFASPRFENSKGADVSISRTRSNAYPYSSGDAS